MAVDVRVGCVSVAAVKLGMAATAVMSVVLVMSVVVTEKVVVAVCCSCGCVWWRCRIVGGLLSLVVDAVAAVAEKSVVGR